VLLPLLISFALAPLSSWASLRASGLPELRVLTYESLASTEGLGPVLFAAFEKRCGCRVKVQTAGDAGQILSRLQLERLRGRLETQVVVGIDQTLWPAARDLAADLSVAFDRVSEVADSERGWIPYDWGVLALMVREGFEAPMSWRELLEPRFKRKFILQDPRTSTPGFAFVWGASQVVRPAAYFTRLRSCWLTLAPGWSGAYSLFLAGEAPMVWSYTTSEAYHREHSGEQPGVTRYRAAVFSEGNPVQVEGAFAVESALRSELDRRLARQFLELLVSNEVQSEIPLRQWMFPARRGIVLPRSFSDLPAPKKVLKWDADALRFDLLTRSWEGWIRR
jgi:thiamine transport system substrate-binding protein